MSNVAFDIASAGFRRALNEGPSVPSRTILHEIEKVETDRAHSMELEAFTQNLLQDIPFVQTMRQGYETDTQSSTDWESAVRWVLSQIREWGRDGNGKIETLRILAVAAYTLDAGGKGLAQVASTIVTPHVCAGLRQLVANVMFVAYFPFDRRLCEAHDAIRDFAGMGQFDKILPRLKHIIFIPPFDFSAYVTLLYNSFSRVLAEEISRKSDLNISALACEVLGENSLNLALDAKDVGLKFVAIANLFNNRRERPVQSSCERELRALLRQVSESDDEIWKSWMKSFFRWPGQYPLLEQALVAELGSMPVSHWVAFIKAPRLSQSYQAAGNFANFSLKFRTTIGNEKFYEFCHLAFRIWDEWDYKEESQPTMYAPVACALDFPVIYYFANQSNDFLDEKEASLLEHINSIELQWFESQDLMGDSRYRILSRLRLLQHARKLKNGEIDALPPLIKADPQPYFRARFHFMEPPLR